MKLLALGCGVWGVGCVLGQTQSAAAKRQSPEPRAVRISNFTFAPAELMVARGDTVVWSNEDAFSHTVTADSAAWGSPEFGRGKRFEWVPKQAGRFPYHCAAHPVMRGVVVVRE